jgi:hypothetical protein
MDAPPRSISDKKIEMAFPNLSEINPVGNSNKTIVKAETVPK